MAKKPLAAESDSLFIEEVAGNAGLEGRSRYLLIDDLDQERAFSMYDEFGFRNKKLVWSCIGGKIGDITRLKVELNLGKNEAQGLEWMLRDGVSRLENLLRSYHHVPPAVVFMGEKLVLSPEDIRESMLLVAKHGQLSADKLDQSIISYLVKENILFWEPVSSMVRFQGELVRKGVLSMKKTE